MASPPSPPSLLVTPAIVGGSAPQVQTASVRSRTVATPAPAAPSAPSASSNGNSLTGATAPITYATAFSQPGPSIDYTLTPPSTPNSTSSGFASLPSSISTNYSIPSLSNQHSLTNEHIYRHTLDAYPIIPTKRSRGFYDKSGHPSRRGSVGGRKGGNRMYETNRRCSITDLRVRKLRSEKQKLKIRRAVETGMDREKERLSHNDPMNVWADYEGYGQREVWEAFMGRLEMMMDKTAHITHGVASLTLREDDDMDLDWSLPDEMDPHPVWSMFRDH